MNGVVIHKEIQTIETCFLGNDKGNLYINPMEGYIRNDDKNSRSRKPAISIEEDPSPEPATPEDSHDFPNENNSNVPKNKHSGSNSASDGAPNERLNDLSPRRQVQGRENSKPGAINSVPNIQGNDPTKAPEFILDTDSEDDILSDGTPLTPLHISEEEDNNERNKANNKQSNSSMDKLDEKNRKNATAKDSNESKPLDPSELFPVINRTKDKNPPQPVNEKVIASPSSSDGSETDSSTTTEGCDSPTTLANLDAELGSDPALHTVIKNNWNERVSPELRPPPYPQPPPYLVSKQDKPQTTAPEARQSRPHGPRGPPPRGYGPRGPGFREHGPRGQGHQRDPVSRGPPPRDHREHGPRGPGQRDPRDQRDHRDLRDPRDPLSRPLPQRDSRDHREPGSREAGPRGSGPRDPGPRPCPREPVSKGPALRDPISRIPLQKEQGHREPSNRGPVPRPLENRGSDTQQNIPPFPVFSNFYDQPPVDKDRGQRLKTVGRNQGPIAS